MSLFPAYAEEAQNHDQNKEPEDTTWLENSSFQSALCLPVLETKTSTVSTPEKSSKATENTVKSPSKKRKKKAKKTKNKPESPTKKIKEDIVSSEYFYVDVKGCREFLNIITVARPAVPLYKVKYFLFPNRAYNRKRFKRYHQLLHVQRNTDAESEQKITKHNIEKIEATKDEHFTGFKQEEELSQKTATFNQHLFQYPCDIKKWIEYVQFQDTLYQFEKTYKKGSIAKAQRVLAERKISILDKALSQNPDSDLLHREKLTVMVSAFPADELQFQIKELVEKDKSNIILWQGYIEATQCSMSHCNTPAVMDLYTKCLSMLHKLRRATTLEKSILEESILRMLYQCGLFLKQAGLFEQLWTLLRMYLELNLSPLDNSKFNISSKFNEKQLVELENIIFTSHLPLHELWLRTEKLRESCHWLPYLDDDNCEDPQRLVFTEDVAELIHPITMPENTFKLIATIFSLLKIPLLPCRHTTMQDLGLDYVPWSLDSIEPLLSIFLPMYPVDIDSRKLFGDNRLAVGPQYLKSLPGQAEYLLFILTIMKKCSECLTDDDKIVVTLWLLRFQRLLLIINSHKMLNISDHVKKQIKKDVKELLKIEENRQNTLYYLEYALLEYELGAKEKCLSVISMAIKMLQSETTDKTKEKCCLYKAQVHIILSASEDKERNKEALKVLCELALKRTVTVLSPSIIIEANEAFDLETKTILQQPLLKLQPLQQFLPDFLTDWIICNGWFIYINRGIFEYIKFIEEIISMFSDKNLWQKEILYESYVAVVFKHSVEFPASGIFKTLDKALFKAIEHYPNNLFLLAVLAKEQSTLYSIGPRWWKVQNLLIKSGRALSTLFAVITLNQQIVHFQEAVTDSITGQHYEINVSLKNRMLTLFKKITGTEMCTRRCGLVWRLYLQFVYTYSTPEICRKVYYCAVEECPWLKALYIDAAIYIPTELPQIQDLIIEKQLRLHVTPEELDVLRD